LPQFGFLLDSCGVTLVLSPRCQPACSLLEIVATFRSYQESYEYAHSCADRSPEDKRSKSLDSLHTSYSPAFLAPARRHIQITSSTIAAMLAPKTAALCGVTTVCMLPLTGPMCSNAENVPLTVVLRDNGRARVRKTRLIGDDRSSRTLTQCRLASFDSSDRGLIDPSVSGGQMPD
jgi:hypothetical protein